MHLALIGFRCSGKTTAGRLLAEKLGGKFIDTDDLTEKMSGFKIHRFVALNGWAPFRKIESQALERALIGDFHVIATGGGIVLQPENVRNLKRKAIVFWLRTSADVIKRRISRQSERILRPGLTHDNPVEEVEFLIQQRTPLYLEASDYIVDTDQSDPGEVMENICRLLEVQHRERR
jgi:shikimate kinase